MTALKPRATGSRTQEHPLPSGLEFPRTVPRQQMLRLRLPPLRSPLSQLNSVFLAVKRQVEGQPPELADTDVTRDFRLHLGRSYLAAKLQSQPHELPSITSTQAAASSDRKSTRRHSSP